MTTEHTTTQQQWRDGVSTLISYRYLGTYSEVIDRHHADGWITIRRDLRGALGLRSAPLGIALLDTAGINVDPLAVVSPTRIDLELFEPAFDVARVHFAGRIVREAKSQFFTESVLSDAHDPDRVIGMGSTHWAVSGPNPGFNYVDSRPGVADAADLPPLHEPYGARLRDDGELEIPEERPELGRHGLHQGPFQVIPESAAMLALERHLGHNNFWIEHQGTSIVARGAGAPFVTSTTIVRVTNDVAAVRVELRAEGADNRLCSTTLCRFRVG